MTLLLSEIELENKGICMGIGLSLINAWKSPSCIQGNPFKGKGYEA